MPDLLFFLFSPQFMSEISFHYTWLHGFNLLYIALPDKKERILTDQLFYFIIIIFYSTVATIIRQIKRQVHNCTDASVWASHIRASIRALQEITYKANTTKVVQPSSLAASQMQRSSIKEVRPVYVRRCACWCCWTTEHTRKKTKPVKNKVVGTSGWRQRVRWVDEWRRTVMVKREDDTAMNLLLHQFTFLS